MRSFSVMFQWQGHPGQHHFLILYKDGGPSDRSLALGWPHGSGFLWSPGQGTDRLVRGIIRMLTRK